MDTLGDADEDDYGDDEPGGARGRGWSHVTTTESLAVASLALAVTSFFAGGLIQYLNFALGESFRSPRSQYLVYVSPTALFAVLAVALGLTVTRRRHGDRWTAGIAGAGVIVGGIAFILTLIGVVLAFTLDGANDVLY
jgi:hypothetical protein